MAGMLNKMLSAGSAKDLEQYKKVADRVNELEPSMKRRSDDELRGLTAAFRERLERGEGLDHLMPEAFAAVREMSSRVLGMRHFDVQVVGAAALHAGRVAEMRTGEGKTLVSTLAGYLNALPSKGVHVVTVNEYLAGRDSAWMGRLYRAMGMEVGLVKASMGPAAKQAAYAADVTYGTNSELGFDYLRDNMAASPESRMQRGHHFAIVDEVDSILIDEARTPLIISGQGSEATPVYRAFAEAVRGLAPGKDFEMDEAKRTIMATDEGLDRIEERLGMGEIYDDLSGGLANHLHQALKAEYLFHRDKDYVVTEGGDVMIVDEFTGRIMDGRRYSDGLHQAIEAKERVEIKEESTTLATITLQNYFRLYDKLSGMTGTGMTEDSEFRKTYRLPVQEVPSNRPPMRVDFDDLVYLTEAAKFDAVAADIEARNAKGQPVLVGTATVESSERLSAALSAKGIAHEVLNAKNHEREALIVAQAGREGAVTIATNMAGRGTDILLGGNPEVMAEQLLAEKGVAAADATEAEREEALAAAKATCAAERARVLDAGGLAVIGTERHESRRIDNQLRGRSGRQGDPGESQFYLSLEDSLLRLFGDDRMARAAQLMRSNGVAEDEAISSPIMTKAVEGAQRKVEDVNFSMRKNVLDYDDVMDKQRKAVYAVRDRVMDGELVGGGAEKVVRSVVEGAVERLYPEGVRPGEWETDTADEWARDMTGLGEGPALYPAQNAKGLSDSLYMYLIGAWERQTAELGDEFMATIGRRAMLAAIDERWKTYLQEMDYLKQGIGLRGFGQRDPLVEYKQEAYRGFDLLVAALFEDYVRSVLRVKAADAYVPERSGRIVLSGPSDPDLAPDAGRIAVGSNLPSAGPAPSRARAAAVARATVAAEQGEAEKEDQADALAALAEDEAEGLEEGLLPEDGE